MFKWDENLIKVLHNFANEEELGVLNNYLESLPGFSSKSVAWLDFIEGEHDPKDEITDPRVISVMRELQDRTHKYITEVYIPESGLKVLRDNGNRGLELIRWPEGASLGAHSDWREPDGSPHPLTLPQFTFGTLIYINKDYSGGEINFPDYDFKLDTQPGDLILFPCQYMHEVLEVSPLEGKKKAKRYTLPVFYWFDLEAKEA